jgi:hypothetical protein
MKILPAAKGWFLFQNRKKAEIESFLTANFCKTIHCLLPADQLHCPSDISLFQKGFPS